ERAPRRSGFPPQRARHALERCAPLRRAGRTAAARHPTVVHVEGTEVGPGLELPHPRGGAAWILGGTRLPPARRRLARTALQPPGLDHGERDHGPLRMFIPGPGILETHGPERAAEPVLTFHLEPLRFQELLGVLVGFERH